MEHERLDNIVIQSEGKTEIIDTSSLKPLNDPNCTHEWINDDDVIGDMRALTCLKCPVGRWVKLEVSPES